MYKTIVSSGGRCLFVKIRPRDCAPVNNSGRRLYRTPYWCNLEWPWLVSSTTISATDALYAYSISFIQRYFSRLQFITVHVTFLLSILLLLVFHYIRVEFITSRTIYSREILKKRIIQIKVTFLSLSLFFLSNEMRIKWKWRSMIWRRRKNKKREDKKATSHGTN